MADVADGTVAGAGLRSAIARPLDMRYVSNRAVVRLMPVAVAVAGAVALMRGLSVTWVVGAAVGGALAAFGGWALARELAPDDNAAAFVSMALAFATLPVVEPLTLLVLFTTMLLVRIVNRTVGLAARVADSIIVTGLAATTVYLTKIPLFGIVAALAFALDAVLHDAHRRQWVFTVLCVSVAGTWLVRYGSGLGVGPSLSTGTVALLAVVALGFAAAILLTRVVRSTADVTGDLLRVSRVRAGMLIALLVAQLALLSGQPGLVLTAPVWAALAGVAGSAAVVRPWSLRPMT